MNFTVEIPDSLVKSLHLTAEGVNRNALEHFAVKAYSAGKLSQRDLGELLGLGYWEADHFLKHHRAYQELSYEEFRQETDLAAEVMISK